MSLFRPSFDRSLVSCSKLSLVGQSHIVSLGIWVYGVLVATAAKWWKARTIALTAWRRWLPGVPSGAVRLGIAFLGVGLLGLGQPADLCWAQLDKSNASAATNLSELKTVAEATGYKATADGAAVELFLTRVQRQWTGSTLESIGQTVEGRPIWALVVPPASSMSSTTRSNTKSTTQSATQSAVITVLLLGGIHSGECDGKESLLALARNMALGKHTDIRQNVRLIFVPNFNADGNQRVSPKHRPGQAGPEAGMGTRENAQGLDLNRDFVKLETPEVRALVAAIDRYQVDVLIDTHTTNGSLHRYDLTYAIANNPLTPRDVDAWLRDQMLPAVTSQLKKLGLDSFYYGNFEQGHTVWKSYGHEPRYSTELMGARGKIGILAESYSYASYQRRIEVTDLFVRQVLQQLNEHSSALRSMLDRAAASSNAGSSLPVRAELAMTAEEVTVLGYQQSDGTPPQPPYGPTSAATHQPKDYRIPMWVGARASREVKLPAAYAIAPSAAWALSRLKLHGITIERLTEPVSNVACEQLVIEKREAGAMLQNHRLHDLTIKAVASELSLPAGTYIVRTSGALGRWAAYLLEPESEDGLFAWNFFDPDLQEEQPVPVSRVIGDLPKSKLQLASEIAPTEPLTFDHVMKPGKTAQFSSPVNLSLRWLDGSNQLLLRRDQSWWTIDAATGATTPGLIMNRMREAFGQLDVFKKNPGELERLSPEILSDDQKVGLIELQNDLFLYDATSHQARQITQSPKAAEQVAQLSPTGSHVAYVRDNDLYVMELGTGREQRITQDGSSELLNGILDWVYQEEIYGRGQFRAFWFSPDGQRIAFLQLDQSPVQHYEVSDSISYRQTLEDTRYPKAGDPLPIARMWIATLADGSLREVDLSRYPVDDRLVVRVTWSPKNELWLQIQNRIQTEQSIVRVDVGTGQASELLREKSPGWIEVLGQPSFLPDGDFLWISDLPQGRRHLHRYDMQTQKLEQLTRGDWDMVELAGVTADGKTAYVTGNYSHPTELQLMRVDTQTGQTERVTTEPGTHRIKMTHDCQYYVDTWSQIDQPPQSIMKSIDGRLSRVVVAQINDRYRYVARADMKLTTIRARDGLEMQSLIMLPRDWSEKASSKLPVLFHVYAGPQAPTVNNAWSSNDNWWHQYLCSQGFAVVLCDNRSSRGRGIADTWKIHRDLGRVELQDIEDAVDWVSTQPWADRDRMGIWGWSYGGYMTAYALTHSNRFKAGISGAPVTDWRNYDAIYTERYMDLPKNNPTGYDSSSAVKAAANMHGRMLLIHGERDDNVHMSNTLQMALALQKAGKPFDMMIYPKNRHGIMDPAQRYHLYQTMTDFLERHLKHGGQE